MVAETEKLISEIQDGYASDGPVLKLGALVHDDEAYSQAPVQIPLRVLNRHGLVAGATGTGKTKTLQLMAEQLSANGVPVFLADMKGDLSGLASSGEPHDKISARAEQVGQNWQSTSYPTEFFSLGGEGKGVPVRCTVTAFGPTLLAKVLDLTKVQTSALQLIFSYADKSGLPLLDLKDLHAVVKHLTSDEGKAELKEIGGISTQTAGVIMREITAFSESGAEKFFGEPEFDTADFLRSTDGGQGIISALELKNVATEPRLFSTFLMWLLADLYQALPEVGDLDKPKLVFFFDEAHLLFNDASSDFMDQITQTVRLIRSKGVGVFFVTQSPTDLPDEVLAQLGSRVQHALRAFTPNDAKALKATASTYPTSEFYDMTELLTSVGIGEAVVTVLNEKGAPTPVAWTRLQAPQSLMAPSTDEVIDAVVGASPLMAEYGQSIDRDSAYERLNAKLEQAAQTAQAEAEAAEQVKRDADLAKEQAKLEKEAQKERERAAAEPSVTQQVLGSSAMKSFLRSAGTVLGREITRSILGTGRRR